MDAMPDPLAGGPENGGPVSDGPVPPWFALGLLFENCTCQIICPGHVHFDQLCTHERCKGWWAIRIDEGELDGVSLNGVNAVVAMDSPRHMIDGGWLETIIIDEAASPEQRQAVEMILRGDVGGPWEVLGRFVEKRLETRFVPIRIDDEPKTKRITAKGVLQGVLTAIGGRERSQPVRIENCFNQIHAPSQVIASGDCDYDDGVIVFSNEESHGLWSRFHWSVAGQ